MSVYNLKIIDYGSFLQVRTYKKPICTDSKEKIDKEFLLNEDIKLESDVVLDEKREIKDKEHSARVSMNRTIQSIYKYVYANQWDWFCTLTFAETEEAYSYDYVVGKLTNWLKNLRRYAPELKYLFVPEQHKSGKWHFHGLLACAGQVGFSDSGRVFIGDKAYKRTEKNKEYPAIYNIDRWVCGWSTATIVKDTLKVGTYICKYITKDLNDALGKRRKFYPSNNLDKPLEVSYNWAPDDIKDFVQSLGDRIDYIKTQTIPQAHQRIQYITVKKA